MQRRHFLHGTTAAAIVPSVTRAADTLVAAEETNESAAPPLVVGIMGFSRGRDLAEEALKIPGVKIKYICETDKKRGEAGVKRVAEAGGLQPRFKIYGGCSMIQSWTRFLRRSESLAWSSGDLGMQSRKACLRREAGVPQSAGGGMDGCGREQVQPLCPNR